MACGCGGTGAFSRPARGMIALPARWPVYVIPCSHLLDFPYVRQLNPNFPFPRQPWPFESESRAPGTGLISAGQTTVPCPPTTTKTLTTASNWRR